MEGGPPRWSPVAGRRSAILKESLDSRPKGRGAKPPAERPTPDVVWTLDFEPTPDQASPSNRIAGTMQVDCAASCTVTGRWIERILAR